MSVLVIISRITGFFRTIAQAYGMGATLGVASAFTVANGMPNQLYELVMGGMLVTAFLPVYVSAKKQAGKEGASSYASNLISLVTILMVALTVLSLIFAGPIIYSQSFGASEGFDFDLAVYFFRYFAICIVFYALSSVISSVLNAERDYLWSTLAPVANNIVTTAAFLLYGLLVSMGHPEAAILVLAIGNPLSVLIQVLVQVPSLKRHGIRLRLRVDIHDPRIRETLSIGIPTLIVTVVSFATNSVQSATSLQVDPNGAVITYYARVWYVLPYAVLAIPVTVAMFTELSVFVAEGRMQRFIDGVADGCGKILFMLTPFAMYLMVFAPALSYMLGSSRMPEGTAESLAVYLAWLSISLPGYGVCTYLQKACSSLRKMRIFALAECVAGAIQIAICLIFTPIFGLNIVGFSSTFFFIAIDAVTLFIIRRELGSIGGRKILASLVKSLAFGALGAAVGFAGLFGLEHLIAPLSGSAIQAIAYAVAAGLPAVIATFGLALALKVPEASFIATALRLKRPGAARS
ncbi:MAG: murein biosynthesis integral membrane protein MurJ [Coriobacteriaceae bacterium]|nr:murein biosynthesis integral membrane protein MurJ [Coriobacteriaceae bacterium]